jgi:D-proline reductase (dithiol) PrdB
MPILERLTKVQQEMTREHLKHCPSFESHPWVNPPPLNRLRVAMITTGGLHTRTDRPFEFGVHDSYRIVPGHVQANDLVISHGEPSFDRIGFQRDYNVAFPLDRLREMVAKGIIESVADFHYSFGAPMSTEDTEAAARGIAGLLKKDKVNAVLFPSPVCPGCTRDGAILARYIEEEGIATACISAIKPYSEIVKPPRSLWVPFELGRPLGVPNDASFQNRVLLALLKLFNVPENEGPVVLVDYPEDAPPVENDMTVISCPVYYGDDDTAGMDPMEASFLREIKAMRPWYDLALAKRQRTTLGASGVAPDSLGEFIYAFIKGETPENPRTDVELITTLKLAIEDLRAYYNEGATAQPGQENVSLQSLKDWFWNNTAASNVLLKLLEVCENRQDEHTRLLIGHFVPTDIYAQYKGKAPH